MFGLVGRHIWLLGVLLAPVAFAAKLVGAVVA
jgi:hypothetical protein